MKWFICRKTILTSLVLVSTGTLGYLFLKHPETDVELPAPAKRKPGVYSIAELQAAMSKVPPATEPGYTPKADHPEADLVPPAPVKHKGNAESPEKFRAVMEEARNLQSEWKIFSAEHRNSPRSDWNRAARQWQHARASRLDAVRDGAGITFPLRHPSEELPGVNNDALVPDYINPQRNAPAPANVMAFRKERERLAAERDTAVHATEGLPPAKRMQKMKEWEDTNQTRLAANRSAAFMLRELPLELIPPVPLQQRVPANSARSSPPPQPSPGVESSVPANPLSE